MGQINRFEQFIIRFYYILLLQFSLHKNVRTHGEPLRWGDCIYRNGQATMSKAKAANGDFVRRSDRQASVLKTTEQSRRVVCHSESGGHFGSYFNSADKKFAINLPASTHYFFVFIQYLSNFNQNVHVKLQVLL